MDIEDEETVNYAPNIQLNYAEETPSDPESFDVPMLTYNNRQIKNNKSFLQFNFSTGGDYVNKFAIGLDGNIDIGGSAGISGSLGIGTTTPTEKFQIGDYAWMGKNTSVKT